MLAAPMRGEKEATMIIFTTFRTLKIFTFEKIFNPVLRVWVWLYANGTGLFPGPGGDDLEYIFRFVVSCTVSEE